MELALRLKALPLLMLDARLGWKVSARLAVTTGSSMPTHSVFPFPISARPTMSPVETA